MGWRVMAKHLPVTIEPSAGLKVQVRFSIVSSSTSSQGAFYLPVAACEYDSWGCCNSSQQRFYNN